MFVDVPASEGKCGGKCEPPQEKEYNQVPYWGRLMASLVSQLKNLIKLGSGWVRCI